MIDNAVGPPIAGKFNDLPGGSIFTENGNTCEVSYESGDDNDLTLTVVP